MVDGLLPNVGIGIVLPCRSSYLATSASVQIRTRIFAVFAVRPRSSAQDPQE